MSLHNPPHSGEFIQTTYLQTFGLSTRSLAESRGVASSTVNRIITSKSGISLEVALRLRQGVGTLCRALAGDAGELRFAEVHAVEFEAA